MAVGMRALALVAFLLLSGCGDDRPPAPTAEQSEQLNAVESELDALANEEGPADRSAGPSNSND